MPGRLHHSRPFCTNHHPQRDTPQKPQPHSPMYRAHTAAADACAVTRGRLSGCAAGPAARMRGVRAPSSSRVLSPGLKAGSTTSLTCRRTRRMRQHIGGNSVHRCVCGGLGREAGAKGLCLCDMPCLAVGVEAVHQIRRCKYTRCQVHLSNHHSCPWRNRACTNGIMLLVGHLISPAPSARLLHLLVPPTQQPSCTPTPAATPANLMQTQCFSPPRCAPHYPA